MKITPAGEFLKESVPIIDVRSPAEFEKGHIPGAVNIPVLDDEERRIVGTLYKQAGREEAVEKGLELVGPKAPQMLRTAMETAVNGKLRVYCWRGGMRSKNMATLFEMSGLSCSLLDGGYKAYRNYCREIYASVKELYVLAGPTGSGKTEILKAMEKLGEQVVDLEGAANHKGSVFGSYKQEAQPSTEHFQNLVARQFMQLDPGKRIWVESESLAIGNVFLPQELWMKMNQARIVELQMNPKLRAKRLMLEYGSMPEADLIRCIRSISERMGPQHAKAAIELVKERKSAELTAMLLAYYDKSYAYGREKHRSGQLTQIICETGDAAANAALLLKTIKNEH